MKAKSRRKSQDPKFGIKARLLEQAQTLGRNEAAE